MEVSLMFLFSFGIPFCTSSLVISQGPQIIGYWPPGQQIQPQAITKSKHYHYNHLSIFKDCRYSFSFRCMLSSTEFDSIAAVTPGQSEEVQEYELALSIRHFRFFFSSQDKPSHTDRWLSLIAIEGEISLDLRLRTVAKGFRGARESQNALKAPKS